MTPAATQTRRAEFWLGVKEELPLQIGIIPFGLVFGILGLESGLTFWQTILMSSILFGGASQIVFAQLVATGTPAPVLIGSVSTINLRHVLYSISIADYIRALPLGWRIILGYLLTDEAYAVTIKRFQTQPSSAYMHYHLLGTGMTLWVVWQVSTITGALAGTSIPGNWQLGFAVPLTFLAIIAPNIKLRADLAAAIAAGTSAILLQFLPWNLWLIAAALIGIATGVIVNRNDAQAQSATNMPDRIE